MIGDRVQLLDKTCGPIKGLRECLNRGFKEHDDLIPNFGTIIKCVDERSSPKWGAHYLVKLDHYDSKIHRHKNCMFYKDDLIIPLAEWIEDDLFTI